MGRGVAVAVAAVVAVALAAPSRAAAADERPNILVFVTDDQRGGLPVMPFVRRWFGAGGVRYPNAFANTPLCCPARASIMTGQYAHNHGVLNNQSATSLDESTTMQRSLHGAGYRTALIGKFMNQWELRTPPPYFDRWSLWSNRLDGAIFRNDPYNGGLWNLNGAVREVDTYSTRFVASRVVSFLKGSEADDAVPWLLYVAPSAPHLPATPEEKYADTRIRFWPGNPATAETDLSDKPPWWRTRGVSERYGRRLRARQMRALMSVDDAVARIAHTLHDLGETNSTLAFFFSDNGFLWSEHGRKGKTFPYNQSVKIPMFARWPGRIAPGSVDSRLVALVDIAPTIFDATGAAPSVPVDGRSLLDAAWRRDHVLLEYFPSADSRTPGWGSIWSRAFQYTEYYARDTGDVSFRDFYDLVADRWQLENRYADADATNDPSEEDTALLRDLLARDRDCAADTCP